MEKIIFTKQEIEWYIIHHYLEAISTIGAVDKDVIFCKMFNDIKKYVTEKLTFNGEGDVLDLFVVALQCTED